VTSPPTPQDRAAFYGAAVLGLRALDARETTARRFGRDAEARWTQFAGALGVGDRIDILLRDAAGTWGTAFSPSECFGFFGLADDEPFGPDWGGIDEASAKRLLAEPTVVDTSSASGARGPGPLDRVASGLGVKAGSVPVPSVTPSTRLVVAGGTAIVSVARVFAANEALSWTDQVVVVAEKAAWRQLAGLAAVLLGARGRTALVRPTEADKLRALGFAHLEASVVSPDAEPEAAELARKVGGQ
jgi:hypothetical protein